MPASISPGLGLSEARAIPCAITYYHVITNNTQGKYCFIFKTLDNFQSLRTESIYFSLIFSRVGSRTLILLMTSVVYDQSENCIVGVVSSSKWKNKPMTMFDSGPCDWFVLPLLLPTPTTQFSLDHKRRSRKRNRNRKKWKRSDSSESDSVELMTPLTTPFFDFY